LKFLVRVARLHSVAYGIAHGIFGMNFIPGETDYFKLDRPRHDNNCVNVCKHEVARIECHPGYFDWDLFDWDLKVNDLLTI
jgi:hypothetical protein